MNDIKINNDINNKCNINNIKVNNNINNKCNINNIEINNNNNNCNTDTTKINIIDDNKIISVI